jgi:hypothetical protein
MGHRKQFEESGQGISRRRRLMPRAVPAIRVQVVMDADNVDFIDAVVAETGVRRTEAINDELDFLRLLGLPERSRRRIEATAAQRRSSLRDYLQGVVTDHAAQLAPARAPAPRKRGSPLRTNAAFTTANHAYLAARAAFMDAEFSATFNAELRFARTYGLMPEAQARLAAAAAARRTSVRGYVVELLFATAAGLMPTELDARLAGVPA